ncbi:phosphomevalonate kinase, partial [Limosilactobacillus fermentum]|nr:phosphomevalonate kinase [Limosilactobacillus fermentum]
AASVYGGWIAYRSFDRQWLSEQRHYLDLPALLSLPWPDLKIEPLDAPANLALLIGWTGKPASTSRLVDKISLFKAKQQDEYHRFLDRSKACIHRMIDGFHTGDLDKIKEEIRYNRNLLQELAHRSGVQIETPLLKKLCQIAEEFGGAAKTSGAGGGDCGIVAIDGHADLPAVLDSWAKSRIEHLPLSVYFVNNIRRYTLQVKQR